MSSCENLKFCSHCECNLPARTFRDHRDRFYNPVSNTWQKDVTLTAVDSGEEDEHMEISEDDTVFNTLEEEFVNVEDLLSSEIWDESNICDVEEDFPQNESGSMP